MNILGISSYFHDSAACLVSNGYIVAAIQEERLSRVKHDPNFPSLALKRIVDESAIDPSDIDLVVYFEKPFLKFDRIIESILAHAPHGFNFFAKSIVLWAKEKLFLKRILRQELEQLFGSEIDWKSKILFSEHHVSHAASAFYPSPFESAAVLTVDGVGEWATTTISVGKGSQLEMLKEISFPNSIGLLYSAFTYYCGFKVNSGEYKLMGLAPYGKPLYADLIRQELIHVFDDGSYQLNMKYFDFTHELRMTNSNFDDLFGKGPRNPETEITTFEMDIAASIQVVTEEVVIGLAKYARMVTGERNLCLAGGVALNCVANGKLLAENIFDKIWVQPASGDAGGALGAALLTHFLSEPKPKRIVDSHDSMRGSLLGNRYESDAIEKCLTHENAKFVRMETNELTEQIARRIAEGAAVGWFQGSMEFGPRALGNRSILADPRSEQTQKNLNLKIKFRESFRPFAPSILEEMVNDWFELRELSPYMLMTSPIRTEKRLLSLEEILHAEGISKLKLKKSQVPAVTHVDFSARIQTVSKRENPMYHQLITDFYKLTQVPMLVNTSFNVRGEPIVESPKDAYRCFMGTDLDILVIGNYVLEKSQQQEELVRYHTQFSLD